MELVGRGPLLSVLDQRLDTLPEGGGVVLLTGEPGIGKTTLARAVLHRAAGKGYLALEGRAFDHAVATPFVPLVHAISRWSRTADPATVARLTEGLDHLGRLIPTLPGPERTGDPATGRVVLFESVATLVERMTDNQPVVLLVDDLQWLDADTADLLRIVSRDLHQLPLLLLGTLRDEELPGHASALLADLRRAGPTVQLPLDRLGEADVTAIATRHLGRAPTRAEQADLVARSAGTPLFVEALARQLAAGGSGPVVEAVDVVDRVLASADTTAEEITAALGVHGGPVALTVLAQVLDRPADELRDAADALVSSGLVAAEGDALELYHPVLASAATRRLAAAERRALHARFADALRAVGAPLEERGRHVLGAGDLVPADDALEVLLAAGQRLFDSGSMHEAARSLARAVELARSLRPEILPRLLVRLGAAWYSIGEADAAGAALDEAVHLARPRGDRWSLNRALRVLVDVDWYRGRMHRFRALVDELRPELDPPDDDLLLTMMRLLGADLRVGDFAHAAEQADSVLTVARQVGGPAATGTALYLDMIRFLAEPSAGGLRPLVGRISELRKGDTLRGLPAMEKRFLDIEIDTSLALGDLDVVADAERRLLELTRSLPSETSWRIPMLRALRAGRTGDFELAIEHATVVHPTVGSIAGTARRDSTMALLHSEVALRTGEVQLAEEMIGRLTAVRELPHIEQQSLLVARIRVALARDEADTVAHLADHLDLRQWIAMSGAGVATTALELGVALSDRALVERAAAHLEALATPDTALGAAATLARARLDRDSDAALGAAQVFGSLGVVHDQTIAILIAADLAEGDERLALARQAEPLVDRFGSEVDRTRLDVLLGAHTRTSNVRDGGAGPEDLLTRRQLEIAGHVADGLTNRQIAETLHVSIRTVTSHLDHVYTRLGINSRTQLAAWLHARR